MHYDSSLSTQLIDNLQKQVKKWEDWKANSDEAVEAWKKLTTADKDRHTKGREKTKNPTKPNKQKVGFMKKNKKPKKWYATGQHLGNASARSSVG